MNLLPFCTDEFAPLGKMEARALRMPHLPIATVSHPIGGMKPEEVAEKAKTGFRQILKLLGKHS
jgi:hypothetical protein